MLAFSFRLQAAHRYHASRPCESILADNSVAGIGAGLKNTSCGAQLVGLCAPDGSTDVANYGTTPVTGGARYTLYSGCSDAPGSLVSYSYIETPRMLVLIPELAGPVQSLDSFAFGEVMVALDSSLGESATYGHADGRTQYGMLSGGWRMSSVAGGVAYNNVANQNRVFFGAEATRRQIVVAASAPDSTAFSATLMVPAGYGLGDFSFRSYLLSVLQGSHYVGHPAWMTAVKQGAHWGAITVDGVASKRIGVSATLSHAAVSGRRKDGEAADTIYHTRVVGTWASWSLFLAALYADWATPGNLHYWETVGSV